MLAILSSTMAGGGLAASSDNYGMYIVGGLLAAVVVALICFLGARLTLGALGVRFIPNDRVGIIEKLWSGKGSVSEGRILAFNGEAGFEARVLRGGIHGWRWSWQYRIHKVPLVTIPQG